MTFLGNVSETEEERAAAARKVAGRVEEVLGTFPAARDVETIIPNHVRATVNMHARFLSLRLTHWVSDSNPARRR